MNCIERIVRWHDRDPNKLAVWDIHAETTSFSQLIDWAASWQQAISSNGFSCGGTVLLVAEPCAATYAAAIAIIGLGGRLMFIEPDRLTPAMDYAISLARPSILISPRQLRLQEDGPESLRAVKQTLTIDFTKYEPSNCQFQVVDVEPDDGAMISFTSGSQGRPKGIIRTHKHTLELVDLLTEGGCRDAFEEPDLTIFPAIGILHLFSGRGTITVPQNANQSALKACIKFSAKMLPRTLTANPGFFKRLDLNSLTQGFESLEAIYIGGGLADTAEIDRICRRWPGASITHVYGCLEAEPIALVDARKALEKANDLGELKLRYLGEPLPFLKTLQTKDGLWVSGPNVCAESIIDPSRGMLPLPDDNTGYPWHQTGDRIEIREDGWYWSGKISQPHEDFQLEQKAYEALGHTQAFVTTNKYGNAKLLIGENLPKDQSKLLARLPGISGLVKARIIYKTQSPDQIDRAATIRPPRTLQRWWNFLNERANPVSIAVIASGPVFGGFDIGVSASEWLLAMLSFAFVAAGLVLARIMDECKDFDKDCRINPTRPLPRGLLTVSEMRFGIHALTVVMTMIAFVLAYLQATTAAMMGLTATLYLLLMEREFFVGERLAKSPIIYGLVHQLLIVPLYLLPLLAVPRPVTLSPFVMAGFVMANLGGSMAYEISRKLKPSASKEAGTYLQYYGPKWTSLMLLACGIATVLGSISMHTIYLTVPLVILFSTMVLYWRRHPERYRLVESASLMVGLSSLWALAIL